MIETVSLSVLAVAAVVASNWLSFRAGARRGRTQMWLALIESLAGALPESKPKTHLRAVPKDLS